MDFLGPDFLAEFLDDSELRAALRARDIGALYRLLKRLGLSQRQIAGLTGQTQSEVCEILGGRQVVNVWVLERIADGLGLPRARIGLSYGEEGPDLTPVAEEWSEEVKRRILIVAGMSQPFLNLRGEPVTLPLPTDDELLPTRLSMVHVQQVRTFTDQLVGRARYYGGQAGVFGDAVRRYTRWMDVPGPDEVKAQLAAALAELHTEAGWTHHDSGLDGIGYFTRGMGLADDAGDAYVFANAAWHAGVTLVRSGHPNDALKLFTLGTLRLKGFLPGKPQLVPLQADDPRVSTLTARLNQQSATAYAIMGGRDEATRHLAQVNDGWEPRDAFERASADNGTAGIHLDLGQLDAAEQFATSALGTYSESHRRGRTMTQLLLAEVHIRAGEPHGLTLARQAIDGVRTLHSIAARRERLIPLATALEARPSTDTRELARKARKVAATRV
ncbi:MAG: helix-turn-helix transcriptional regulator [Pseudonocardiaceae bacterium]